MAVDLRPVKSALAKLEPPPPAAVPYPAPKPAGTPSLLLRKLTGRKRRR